MLNFYMDFLFHFMYLFSTKIIMFIFLNSSLKLHVFTLKFQQFTYYFCFHLHYINFIINYFVRVLFLENYHFKVPTMYILLSSPLYQFHDKLFCYRSISRKLSTIFRVKFKDLEVIYIIFFAVSLRHILLY